MSNTNTGGPAFPVDRQTAHGIAVHEVGTGNEAAYIALVASLSHGMTLRDYFAAKAVQGFMANKSNPMLFNPEADAQYAYMIADAMLKVRGV